MLIVREATLPLPPEKVFKKIEDVRALAMIKKELAKYSIVRNEAGLQILDAMIHLPLWITVPTRLKYMTQPGKFAELKQIRGGFTTYECAYTLRAAGEFTHVTIRFDIKLAGGLTGSAIQAVLSPFLKKRIEKELTILNTTSPDD